MRKIGPVLLLSASDLLSFLGCRHATWRDLAVARGATAAPATQDQYAELLQKKGLEHERAYLAELQANGLLVATIASNGELEARAAATKDAMQRGVGVIYQAALVRTPWHGYADFLERVNTPSSLGEWSYTVVDTKLARSVKASHAIQLGVYAALLSKEQGFAPKLVSVRLGDDHDVTINTDDCTHFVTAAMRRFEAFVANPPAVSKAEPCAQCTYCKWLPVCEAEWVAADHLSGVANIRSTQIRTIKDAGIDTIAQLSAITGGKLNGMAPPVFDRLQNQARLQVEKRSDGKDKYELLQVESGRGFCRMPKPDVGDIFFDMEGDPLFPGGLEYLFGFVTGSSSDPIFTPFWAHNRDEEKQAFECAVDFIVKRLALHPDAYVYHYAAYEASALKRLSTLHGTREAEIDDLLRLGKLVDLYRVVAEGVRVSEPRYSLKTSRNLLHGEACRRCENGWRKCHRIRTLARAAGPGVSRGDRGL